MKVRLVLAVAVLCAAVSVHAQWTTDASGVTTPGHTGIGVASHSWMRIRISTPNAGDTEIPGGAYQIGFGTPTAVWWGFRLDAANNLHLDRQTPPWTEGVVFKRNGNVGISVADPQHRLEVAGGNIGLDQGKYILWNNSWGITEQPTTHNLEFVFANAKVAYTSAGNVGIGTTAPKGRLDLSSTAQIESRLVFSGQEYYQPGVTSTDGVAMLLGVNRPDNRQLWIADTARLAANSTNSALRFAINPNWVDVSALATDVVTPRWLLLNGGSGYVAIGTFTPSSAYRLDVNGNSRITGDLTVTGNVAARYQDVAEWVPSTEELTAGMVVVLDGERANHVLPSSRAYDTSVAGVVSAQPGLILGEAGPSKAMIATTGRVKVRVDATSGPIRIGDLLVTGNKPGTAMKSAPLDLGGVAIHRPGTVVGKALERLDGGVGEILVLLSLQ